MKEKKAKFNTYSLDGLLSDNPMARFGGVICLYVYSSLYFRLLLIVPSSAIQSCGVIL